MSDSSDPLSQDIEQLFTAFLNAILPTIRQSTIDAIMENRAELFPDPSTPPGIARAEKEQAIDEVVDSIWEDVTLLLNDIRNYRPFVKTALRVENKMTIYARTGIRKIVNRLTRDCRGKESDEDFAEVEAIIAHYVKWMDIHGDVMRLERRWSV